MLRPLLKWAGGKRQLLPALRPHYPLAFNRYIEPFVGSGAVFLDLFGAGRLRGHGARLVDLNPDLIGCYRAVRDHTEAVIAELERLERPAARLRGRRDSSWSACPRDGRSTHGHRPAAPWTSW